MIDSKSLKIITENLPSHYWNTYCDLPIPVKMKWLERFIKKDITKEELYEFISNKGSYYSSVESYKDSEHFLILKDVLEIDLEKYNWLATSSIVIGNKQLDRDVNIWLIQRG